MSSSAAPLTNWSGNVEYRAGAVERPDSLDALRERLADADGTVAVLGTRHTFNTIADADTLIALDRLPGAHAVEIDAAARTATVGPGVTYAQLSDALRPHGLALPNLASLPHISVAGAIATATHGSGSALGCLASAVAGLELLSAGGDLHHIGRDDPRLPGATVHLGALGALTRVTLDLVGAYELRQDVYLDLEWDALDSHFDELMAVGRSVSVFHDFGARALQVWVKDDPDRTAPAELFGARAADRPCHPVPGGRAEHCTAQLGEPGPWCERLPHFRAEFTPSAGAEIQSEWFVPRDAGPAAIGALRERLAPRIRPLLLVAELRTIARDELWMSPHHGRDSAGLHFTWRREPTAVDAVSHEIERALAPFDGRAHPGKRCPGPSKLPRREDFLALRDELDPRGVFATDWHRAHLCLPSVHTNA